VHIFVTQTQKHVAKSHIHMQHETQGILHTMTEQINVFEARVNFVHLQLTRSTAW